MTNNHQHPSLCRSLWELVAIALITALAIAAPALAENGEQGDMCRSDTQCAGDLVCDPMLPGGLGLCGELVWNPPPLSVNARRRVDHRACNSDLDCPQSQACDTYGVCSTGDCAFSCGARQVCRFPSGCVSVECTSDTHCSGVCIDNACTDCREDRDCPDRHICSNNQCLQVECTSQMHCRSDQQCIQNSCKDRCAAGLKWVTAPGLPLCGACVSQRATSSCSSPGQCAIDEVCADGYCIESCNGIRGDVQALRRQIGRMREIQITLDGPPGTPGDPCLSCPRRIVTGQIGSMLEKAGVPQGVSIQIVDRSGSLVADLGIHKPSGGSFPSLTRNVKATPSKPLDLGKEPCGFSLRITNDRGEKLAEGAVCLSGS